ncbi:hypothetical protein LWI29_003518 [Acer saccharum]|uniref:Mitochondrial protein n=1 Tax=Acer saccharum TaxID=4024 RepID=A0AA39RGT6_ACESA|nr:hypothetical protein LWI29_003518 [Acer saccharum]
MSRIVLVRFLRPLLQFCIIQDTYVCCLKFHQDSDLYPDWTELKGMMIPEQIGYLGTWELQTHPENKEVVGCRWVFAIKYHPNSTIEQLKCGWDASELMVVTSGLVWFTGESVRVTSKLMVTGEAVDPVTGWAVLSRERMGNRARAPELGGAAKRGILCKANLGVYARVSGTGTVIVVWNN